MKQRILFTGLFLMLYLFSFTREQPFINVYAYSQTTLGGKKPQTSSGENGELSTLPGRDNTAYHIYAEYLTQEKFTVSALWIKGKAYKVKADSILKTPIETRGNDSKKIILVPFTPNNILLLSPGSQLSIKPRCRLRKMLKKADLIIAYNYNGKTRYYAVAKIKELEVVPAL